MADKQKLSHWARVIIIPFVLYGLLLAVYYFLVLRYLGAPLIQLFDSNLTLYAFAALFLILAQGLLLDMATSFLIKLFGLDQLD